MFGLFSGKKTPQPKYEPPKVATNFTPPPQPTPPQQPSPPPQQQQHTEEVKSSKASNEPHALNQYSMGPMGGFEEDDMFSNMNIKTTTTTTTSNSGVHDEWDAGSAISSGSYHNRSRRGSTSSESSVSSSTSSIRTPKSTTSSSTPTFEVSQPKRKTLGVKLPGYDREAAMKKEERLSKLQNKPSRGRKKGNQILGLNKGKQEATDDNHAVEEEEETYNGPSSFAFVNQTAASDQELAQRKMREEQEELQRREELQRQLEIQQRQQKLIQQQQQQQQDEDDETDDTESENESSDEGEISLTGMTIHSRSNNNLLQQQQHKKEEEKKRIEAEKLRLLKQKKQQEEEQERKHRQEEEERKRKQILEEEKRRKEEESGAAGKTEREYDKLRSTVTDSVQKHFLTPAKQNFKSQQQLLETQKKLKIKLKSSEDKLQQLEQKLADATSAENFEQAYEYEKALTSLKEDMSKMRDEIQKSTQKFQSFYEQMSKIDRESNSKNTNTSNKFVQDFISKTNVLFDGLANDWNVKKSLNDERLTNERERIERQEKSLELDTENVSKRRDRLRAQIDSSTHSERVKVEALQREASDLQEEIDELERQLREKRAMLKSTNENIQLAKSVIEQYEKKFSEELVLLDREQRETEARKQGLQKERQQHEQASRKWQKENSKWEQQCDKRDRVLELAKNLTSDVELVSLWRASLAKLQKTRMEFTLLDQTSSDQALFIELQKYEKQNSILQHELTTCEPQLEELRDRKVKMQNELPELNAKKNAAAKNRKFKDAEQFKVSIKTLEDQIAKIEPECESLEERITNVEKSLRKNAKLLNVTKEKYSSAVKARAENYLTKILVPEFVQLQALLDNNTKDITQSDPIVGDARDTIRLAADICDAEISDAREILEWSDYKLEDLVNAAKIKLGVTQQKQHHHDYSDDESSEDDKVEESEESEEEDQGHYVPPVTPTTPVTEAKQEVVSVTTTVPLVAEVETLESKIQKKLSLLARHNELTTSIAEIDMLIEEAVDQEDFERCDQLDSQAQALKEEVYSITLKLQELADVPLDSVSEQQQEQVPEEQEVVSEEVVEETVPSVTVHVDEVEEEEEYGSVPSEDVSSNLFEGMIVKEQQLDDTSDHEEEEEEEEEEDHTVEQQEESGFNFISGNDQSNEDNEEENETDVEAVEAEASNFSFIGQSTDSNVEEEEEENEENEENEEEELPAFSFVASGNTPDEEQQHEEEEEEQQQTEESSGFSFMNQSSSAVEEEDVADENEEEEKSGFSFI
jgi:hypothetical protein